MKNILIKIAAVVALILGLMATIVGTRVLTGSFDPGYNTFVWLISYNVIMGVVSIFAGYLIWNEKSKALLVSGIITIGHISVLISLFTIFSSVIADQSINAMIFRSVVWLAIFLIVRNFKATNI